MRDEIEALIRSLEASAILQISKVKGEETEFGKGWHMGVAEAKYQTAQELRKVMGEGRQEDSDFAKFFRILAEEALDLTKIEGL